MNTSKLPSIRALPLTAMALFGALVMGCSPTSFDFSGPVRFNFVTGPGKEARSSIQFETDASALMGVDHRHGDVTIEGWEESNVTLAAEVIVRAKTEEIAQRLADEVRIESSVDEEERLWLRTDRPQRNNADKVRQITVNYTLRVPFESDLWLKREHGNTQVSRLQSAVRAHSRHGNLEFRDVLGPLDIDQEHGNADMVDLGSDTTIRKRHGNLKITKLSGGLRLDQEHGHADLSRIDGPITARKRHGGLKGANVSGSLDIESEHGSVDVAFSEGAVASADVRNRHGSVKLRVSPSVGLDLEAAHGGVNSSMPLDHISDHNHGKTASKRSGSPMIRVRTEHGSIHIVN